MNCRCGTQASERCHLCKEPVCAYHCGRQAVTTAMSGYVRIRTEAVCYPNCTASFGEAERPKALPN